MTTKRSSLIAGLVIAVAVAAATAGCGGQQFPKAQPPAPKPSVAKPAVAKSPQARLLAAVKQTTASKSARIALEGTFSGLGSAGTVTMSGTGITDLARHQLQFTIDVAAAGNDISLEMRVVGATAYLQEGGGAWVSMPINSLDAETPNPESYLDFLQGVSNDVHVEGHDTLRGTDTIRYGATLDLGRALARAGTSSARDSLQHQVELFGKIKIPVTVWIDSSGRLRKMEMSLDLGAVVASLGAPAGTDPKMIMSLELYDFGVPVDVQVPQGAISAATAAQDRAAQSDLRNAITAEKTIYTDNMTYSADPTLMRQIEPSLDWGGKLEVKVSDAVTAGDRGVVCLAERSKSGTLFALGDVASGQLAGTYYGRSGCPALVGATSVSGLGTSW